MKIIIYTLNVVLLGSCTYSFEVSSQRTALENQILGTYQEIDEDLVLISSVRAVDESGNLKPQEFSDLQRRALRARQNQEFNRDDIDELKNLGIIGETFTGELLLTPEGNGRAAAERKRRLAGDLIKEENRDRGVIWLRIIQINEELKASDLEEVRKTYGRTKFNEAEEGHWLLDENSIWFQKGDR